VESGEIGFSRLEHLGHLQTIRIGKINFDLLNLSFSGVGGELRSQNGSPKILKSPHTMRNRTLTRTTSITNINLIIIFFYLQYIAIEQALLPQQLQGQLPLAVTAPRRLDEVGTPGPPLVGIVAEGVLQLLAVEALELAGHELEVLSSEREGLDFGDGLDGASGGGEVEAGGGHEGPREQLLAAEVARAEGDGIVEPCSATVCGGALHLPSYDE